MKPMSSVSLKQQSVNWFLPVVALILVGITGGFFSLRLDAVVDGPSSTERADQLTKRLFWRPVSASDWLALVDQDPHADERMQIARLKLAAYSAPFDRTLAIARISRAIKLASLNDEELSVVLQSDVGLIALAGNAGQQDLRTALAGASETGRLALLAALETVLPQLVKELGGQR